MKLLIPMSLAFALAISAMAQDPSQSSGSQSSQSGQSTTGSQSGQSGQTDQSTMGSQSSQTSQSDQSMGKKHKQQKMSGKLSSDNKTFTSDSNKTYTVDNPEAAKGQEGQQVALIVQVDPDTNTVHIIQVAPPSPQQP
jgi:hypothetical protein